MTRLRGLLLSSLTLAAMLVGLGFVVRGPARELRREVLLESAQRSLRDGLERYRERHGEYPPEPFLSGGELAQLLVEGGCLEALPRNPATGEPFGSVDLEVDPLFYATPPGAQSYSLEVLNDRSVSDR